MFESKGLDSQPLLALVLSPFFFLLAACKGDGTPTGASSSSNPSAAPSASVTASGSPAATASASGAPSAAVPPEKRAPRVWEDAASAVRGVEPARPVVEEAAPLWPPCATYEGRELLRQKFEGVAAKVAAESRKADAEKRAAADKEWLPRQQAWLLASNNLDRSLAAGQFIGTEEAVGLDKYGAVGARAKVVKVAHDAGAEAVAFRAALTKDERWSKPFECRLLGAVRSTVATDAKGQEALKAKGERSAPTQV
ncbi:MAG: hypothetical protein FJ096_18130, partial [Deltaproteobacteria bacterium]|nr:hypothetical protein [Deltaproteobacteria bacterium]